MIVIIFHAYQPDNPRLLPYIQTIWYISQNASEVIGMNPRMIPDGCFHMVINLGAPHLYTDKNGNRIEPKRSHINVMQTEFVTVERSGHVEIMGVVFRPHGLYSFMRMPISELTGQILNLDDLLTEQIDLLEEQLASIPTIHEKCLQLERWLENRLHRNTVEKVEIRQEIIFARELMARRGGTIRVRELAAKLDLSERTLERHFQTCYGISPKQYAILLRIHNLLRHMNAESNKMVDYAAIGEYYDQAHFIREFKNLVGVTPKVYLQNRDLLSDLYNTEIRESDTITTN